MAGGIKIHGLEKVLKAAAKVIDDFGGALGASIYQEALSIMGESVEEVPVDFGRLKGTHYVTLPIKTFRGPVVELGYGTDYALPVHEITSAEHTTGKAKYLEDPLKSARSGYAKRIAKRTEMNVIKGVTIASRSAPTRPAGGGN